MKVLVVDDDEMKRVLLKDDLEDAGHEALASASAKEGLALLRKDHYDLVVTDLKMPGMDGLAFLKRIKEEFDERVQVIIMTAHATVDTAVEAMKFGAYDYIAKPFRNEELIMMLDRLGEFRAVVGENVRLRRRLEDRYRTDGRLAFSEQIVGRSTAMQEVMRLAETVAVSEATILIWGETGTGKELIASAIHHRSPRSRGPLVKVSCAALSKELLESELFGHVKGAFTSAVRDRVGKFELAHSGTIFLDEVDDIPLELQVKLLRVLQEHTFERVGGNEVISVDIRVIAATKVDLRGKVANGEYREDLFYRLNVVPVRLPPIRERREDIPPLVDHFLRMFGGKEATIAPDAMRILTEYNWPGNVRELENVIERLVVITGGEREIVESDLPYELTAPPPVSGEPKLGGASLAEIIESTERGLIHQALERTGGNKSRAADILGMKLSTFRDRALRLGIE